METSNTCKSATSPLAAKEQSLIDSLRACESLIVAYSGGVDSSLLAHYAREVLGERAKIVIAISASLSTTELEAAREQAQERLWNLIEIRTDEVEREDYQRNDAMRCYFCKSTLFETLDKMAVQLGVKHVAYGANVDDLSDFRPGHKAAREHNVLSPLQSAALTKIEIRELARAAKLPSWDRPQAACLSSRFPTFEPVTVSKLSRVDKAEAFLHEVGFRQLRVRTHTTGGGAKEEATQLLARLEIDVQELPRFAAEPDLFLRVSAHLKEIGYDLVTLDLDGYKQGSTNVTNLRQREKES